MHQLMQGRSQHSVTKKSCSNNQCDKTMTKLPSHGSSVALVRGNSKLWACPCAQLSPVPCWCLWTLWPFWMSNIQRANFNNIQVNYNSKGNIWTLVVIVTTPSIKLWQVNYTLLQSKQSICRAWGKPCSLVAFLMKPSLPLFNVFLHFHHFTSAQNQL